MSSLDLDISKRIWSGKIPVQIVLGTHDPADTLFMEVPRCSYLPLLTSTLCTQWDRLETIDPGIIWYDYDGEPLKWHYPLGLLYDLWCTAYQKEKKSIKLPWKLTLHTDTYPDVLLQNPTIDTMKDMYMAMLKEADFLRHGSTKKVMNLSKQDQSQLWLALTTERYDDYWHVNHQILDDRTGPAGTEDTASHGPRHVPLRLYLPNQCPVVQDLVSFVTENGEPNQLDKAIRQLVPSMPLDVRVMAHGVQLPGSVPIRWAADCLSYPDNFLHLVVY
ncbi:apg5l protein [Hesseltinella vesiculosa]|uniref:Autophagy protein 5 n=1 Tax=Hesseltinella vesiculosa TaxID=101127 RepID=A0A1X2GKI3_9FUNG|nr:apg5l protein [Hesseltinella vesiculosa]